MQLFYKITNEEKNEVQVYFGGREDFAAETDLFPAMWNSAGLRAGGI